MSELVVALLVDAAGRVLFGRRSLTKATYAGCWDAPGGHVEPGEVATLPNLASPAYPALALQALGERGR